MQSKSPLTEAPVPDHGPVEQSVAGIYLIQEGSFTYVNPEFARIFGYDSPSEIIDQVPMVALIAPEHRAMVLENVRLRVSGKVQEMRYTFTGLRRGGGRIEVEVHGHHIDVNGKPGVIGLLLDVSARRRAERTIDACLGMIGGDLRTPLHQVDNLGELLAGQAPGQGGEAQIAELERATQRLQNLIGAMLELSRLESGETKSVPSDFGTSALLERAAHKISAAAARKGIRLVTTLSPGCPARLHGDARHMARALDALVGNAEKFSDCGEIVLRASLCSGDRAAKRLRVEVADQGHGIEAGIREGIRDLFSHDDHSDTRRYGGVGLGLALCKRLVSLLHGEIGFESRPSLGSTFWLEVPVSLPERAEAEAEAAAQGAESR